MVVGDQDMNLFFHCLVFTRAIVMKIAVPRPGAERIEYLPPSIRIRSPTPANPRPLPCHFDTADESNPLPLSRQMISAPASVRLIDNQALAASLCLIMLLINS